MHQAVPLMGRAEEDRNSRSVCPRVQPRPSHSRTDAQASGAAAYVPPGGPRPPSLSHPDPPTHSFTHPLVRCPSWQSLCAGHVLGPLTRPLIPLRTGPGTWSSSLWREGHGRFPQRAAAPGQGRVGLPRREPGLQRPRRGGPEPLQKAPGTMVGAADRLAGVGGSTVEKDGRLEGWEMERGAEALQSEG